MRTVNVYLKITSANGKSFKLMVKETGRSVHDCLEKSLLGWEDSTAVVERWICC